MNTIVTVLLIIVLVAVAAVALLLIVSSSNDGVASVLGYSPIVLADTKSMEPTLTANDLVIVQKRDATELKEGEIISFWGFVNGSKSIITHRIHEVKILDDGTRCYQTKGDNNELVDQAENNLYRQPDIYPEDVIGVYVTHIAGLGAVLGFLKTPTGILVCMVIPIALVFLWQLYRVIMLALKLHREKLAEQTAVISEAEKQRVIEEYLKQQASGQAEQPADSSDPTSQA